MIREGTQHTGEVGGGWKVLSIIIDSISSFHFRPVVLRLLSARRALRLHSLKGSFFELRHPFHSRCTGNEFLDGFRLTI